MLTVIEIKTSMNGNLQRQSGEFIGERGGGGALAMKLGTALVKKVEGFFPQEKV